MSSGFAVKERLRFVLDEQGSLQECFFLFHQGDEDGPYSFAELEKLHASGKVSPTTPCRSRSGKEWHDLAFILKENAREETPDPVETKVLQQSAAAAPKTEPMNKLVMDLIELSRRQNQLLASIKWSLLGLTFLVVAAGVAIWLR